jgi:hypothetical protein
MLSELENLQSLTLDISNIYLPEAAELAKLKKLRSFTITGCRSEGANLLRDLKTVRSVRVLVPTYGRIQIQGIQFMPGLEEADLVNTAVTEDDIRSLTTCESLKTIRVKKSQQESFSQKTLDHFKKYNIKVIGEK